MSSQQESTATRVISASGDDVATGDRGQLDVPGLPPSLTDTATNRGESDALRAVGLC
jgi:hypothetical protein